MDPILQFFEFEHLPTRLQAVSKPFCELAQSITNETGTFFIARSPERTVCLRKLLEAKDAAVRSFLYKGPL